MLPLILAGAALAGTGLAKSIYDTGQNQDRQRKRLDNYWGAVNWREVPQRGPAALAQNSGFQTNQRDLVTRLEALSKGEGPSLATETLKQATDRNMAQQASIAQSGRGNAALASIMASNNSARLGQQAAGDAATMRIAEQQMALQQLGQNINAGRQSDESTSQFNATQQNFRDRDNIEARLRMAGINDQAIKNILDAYYDQQKLPGIGDYLMGGGASMMSMGASGGGGKSK